MLVYARKPAPENEGEEWLYFDTPQKQYHRVELLEVPPRAKRVRLQHLDREMGGATKWEPIGRFRCPWELRDAYFETESRRGATRRRNSG